MLPLVGSAGPLFQWSWISSQSGTILSLLVQHIELTAIAVGIGLAISLPLGVAAWRLPALRTPLVGFTGLLYVVPSVALMALLPRSPGFSRSPRPRWPLSATPCSSSCAILSPA